MTPPVLRDALTAYLAPLIKKHEADEVLVYEDLSASWKAADAVLKQGEAPNEVVKQVADLHKSQRRAYQEAGRQALHEWASSVFSLPEISPDDNTEQEYVDKCIKEALLNKPGWRLGNAATQEVALNVVKARAKEAYDDAAEDGEEEEEEEEENDEEETDEGEDADDLDGNDDDDDMEGEDETTTPEAPEAITNNNGDEEAKVEVKTTGKKNKPKRRKPQVRKKGTQAKTGGPKRKGPGGGKARRGGKGGGGGNSTK